MKKTLVYAKHTPQDRCGVAYFAGKLSKLLDGQLIHSFHGFARCETLYINMDIWELAQEDVHQLELFMQSGAAGRRILLMHDYRFSYLEDRLIDLADLVVNLSGEPALTSRCASKCIEMFTPPLTEPPVLDLRRTSSHPLTLSFGFFSARKKSFRMYIDFYEHMMRNFPEWRHVIVASSHAGQENRDREMLERLLNPEFVTVLDFIPNSLLSELVHSADLGVCFYPTGIMWNNTAPMSFFAQGRTVITSAGTLTPPAYREFLVDAATMDQVDFNDHGRLGSLGAKARNYFQANLSWDVFIPKMLAAGAAV